MFYLFNQTVVWCMVVRAVNIILINLCVIHHMTRYYIIILDELKKNQSGEAWKQKSVHQFCKYWLPSLIHYPRHKRSNSNCKFNDLKCHQTINKYRKIQHRLSLSDIITVRVVPKYFTKVEVASLSLHFVESGESVLWRW